MTCIIGIAEHGKVWIGGDSAGVSGWNINPIGKKVFRSGEFLIGVTGNLRATQVLQYRLHIETKADLESEDCYMATVFSDEVRSLFLANALMKKDNEVEKHDSAFLVGYKGRLYTVDSDMSVVAMPEQFDFVGCANGLARGAFVALDHLQPFERIKRTLEIVARYNIGVDGPFQIEVLE